MKKALHFALAAAIGITLASCSDFTSPPEMKVTSGTSSMTSASTTVTYSGVEWNSRTSAYTADAVDISDAYDSLPTLEFMIGDRITLDFAVKPDLLALVCYSPETDPDSITPPSPELEIVNDSQTAFLPYLSDTGYIITASWKHLGSATYYLRAAPTEPIVSVKQLRTSYPGSQDYRNVSHLLTTRTELDALLEPMRSLYDSDTASLILEPYKSYDDEFFAEHNLVILGIFEGSGSVKHRVIGLDGGKFTIERLVPEIGTDDIAAHTFFITTTKDFTHEPSLEFKTTNFWENTTEK